MCKILILVPKPNKLYRISKDTSGGYGTAMTLVILFLQNS